MDHKTVQTVISAYTIDMGGILVKQALPTPPVNQVNPFLLLHHGAFDFTKNTSAIQQGLGPHPHRGFTPVTFVIEGEVHHRDSLGNSQIAKKGEVQWMNSGAGIIHSERPSQSLTEKNQSHEVIQLWINTPASKKMDPPSYQYIEESTIPLIKSDDGKITTKLIAGLYDGIKGKIIMESDLLVLWAASSEEGKVSFSIDPSFNTMLYVIRGSLILENYGKVDTESLVIFEGDGKKLSIISSEETQFLIFAGIPLNEKIIQHGPFVMNNENEIKEAIRDYQMGKMGVLNEK